MSQSNLARSVAFIKREEKYQKLDEAYRMAVGAPSDLAPISEEEKTRNMQMTDLTPQAFTFQSDVKEPPRSSQPVMSENEIREKKERLMQRYNGILMDNGLGFAVKNITNPNPSLPMNMS